MPRDIQCVEYGVPFHFHQTANVKHFFTSLGKKFFTP